MLRSLFDGAKSIHSGGLLKDKEFSMIWQHCLSNNQLLQNLKGEGPNSKAPASSKIRKWSEDILPCWFTLVFANASSQLKETENLSSKDVKAVLPSLDHVNFPFNKGTSMSFESSMNEFPPPRVDHPFGERSPPDLVILNFPLKHQTFVQYPPRESNSGHMKFLSL